MTTKTVTLPSGQQVTIKKPGVLGWHRVTGYLPRAVNGESAPEVDPEKQIAATIALVCVCAVEPRYSDLDPVPPGSVSIDDLDIEDFNVLVREVTDFASLVRGTAEVSPLSPTETHS